MRCKSDKLGEAFDYLYRTPLSDIVAKSNPNDKIVKVGGVRFDFNKTHWDTCLWEASADLWSQGSWSACFDSLVEGNLVNFTEGRAALHTACRGFKVPEKTVDGKSVRSIIESSDLKMERLVADIRQNSKFESVIHIGMGGSALGPELVIQALSRTGKRRFRTRFLSNIDGHAFDEAVEGLNPETTLIVVVSKSWTTAETKANFELARKWLEEGNVPNSSKSIIAVTASKDKALKDGIEEDHILTFEDWVGGRFSTWSTVGVTIALQYGWEAFQSFRSGGRLMDEHVSKAGNNPSAPTMSAIMGFVYAKYASRRTRAVFPYDSRLSKLVPYLQQLELESNGKSVTREGHVYDGPAVPVVWGDVGTSAQHAVFQWLHQSTDWAPAEFILVANPDHNHKDSHRVLLSNCFAQSRTLMTGTTKDCDPSFHHPGNRPSTTILIERLTPETLGTLLSYYEHRTYAISCLMGINCFDQMGVELGKKSACEVEDFLLGKEVLDLDPSTEYLVRGLQNYFDIL